jgi:hypothetical protein
MPALPPGRPGCRKAPGGNRPLPDPAAIRLFLVPDTAPPYDDDVSGGEPGTGGLPAWALGGRIPWTGEPGHAAARSGEPGSGEPGSGAESGYGEPGSGEPGSAEPGPGAESGYGEPAGHDRTRGAPWDPAAAPGAPPDWQDRFAQVLAETLAGARPPRQMVPWTTKEALQRIQRLSPQLASAQRPRVRRVLTSAPAADVIELAVVVGFGPRVRALAVRLERAGAGPRPGQEERAAARWLCTAVEAA